MHNPELGSNEDRPSAEIDLICDRFESVWKQGQTPKLEEFLDDIADCYRADLLSELLIIEFHYLHKRGHAIDDKYYVLRFPDDPTLVSDAINGFLRAEESSAEEASGLTGLRSRCPKCDSLVEIPAGAEVSELTCGECGSELSLYPAEGTDIEAPKKLGHFELIEKLGGGGFGSVWRAYDSKLNRDVAIKIPNHMLDAREMSRFIREARAAGGLEHPNIASVYEVGRDGKYVYIVSALIIGDPLSDWLREEHSGLNRRQSVELCIKVAEALGHAHGRGVVHRDLKPQNVMMTNEGEPSIVDFGLAKCDTEELMTQTTQGLLGTPAYMSPEQADGRANEADQRTDIYSLGVILYRLLTGELPFRGKLQMLLPQIVHDEPPSPRKFSSSIDRDLETICLKCLEKEPASRYQTASELAADLGRFLRNEPIEARPIGRLKRSWRWCQRNPVVASLMAVVAVAAILLAGAFVAALNALTDAHVEGAAATLEIRDEGYRKDVFDRLKKTQRWFVDQKKIREIAVHAMGDFVGIAPIDFKDFPAEVRSIALHPKGDSLAVGMKNGSIQLYNMRQDAQPSHTFADHESDVMGMAFNEDGQELLSVEKTGRVIVRAQTAEQKWWVKKTWQTHGGVDSVQVTEDWSTLCVVHNSNDKTGRISVWNLDGEPMFDSVFKEKVRSARYCPVNRLVALTLQNGQRLELRAPKKKRNPIDPWIVKGWSSPECGSSYVSSLDFSSDGTRLAYGSDEALLMFKIDSKEEPGAPEEMQETFRRRSNSFRAVKFSPDGQHLAAFTNRGDIKVWGVEGGEEVAPLTLPRANISRQTLTFSRDNKFLAASTSTNVRVWKLGGAAERVMLAGHKRFVPTVEFTPISNKLISGSKDKTVAIWDFDEETRESVIEDFQGQVQTATSNHDETQLATAYWHGDDGLIQIWDAKTKEKLAEKKHN